MKRSLCGRSCVVLGVLLALGQWTGKTAPARVDPGLCLVYCR